MKFTERGSITLVGRLLEETDAGYLLRFAVIDTGIGISAEDGSKLFAPFQQGDESFTRAHGGAGLGLAINRQLARLMGGEAGFDSLHGVGSTFWFTARVAKNNADSPKPAS